MTCFICLIYLPKILTTAYWRLMTASLGLGLKSTLGPGELGGHTAPASWAGEIPLKLSLSIDPAFVPIFDWTKMQYSVLIEEIDLVYL